jgi:outer membrane lipoprotein SlyB
MKKILKKVLPWIGAAATSGVPGLVAMAAKTVGDVVGKEVGEGVDEIAAAVAGASPEQLASLREQEHKFKLQMAELGFKHEQELEKLGVEDRANARAREVALKDITTRILAYIIVGGFLGMAFGVMFGSMRADTVLAGTIIGYISAKAEQVVSYYFGSSFGSDKKTEILAAQK